MYALILASKYQGQECPWTKVNEQYRFDIMISASGVSFNRYDDIASHQSGPSPSLRPITDISESGVPDYTHVLRFNSAPNSEDERYQTDRKEDFSLEDALLIDPSPDPGLALEIEGDQSKNESARQHITPAPDDSVSADFSRYIKRPQICVKKLLLNNVKPDQIIGAGAQCRDKQERIAKRRLSETENESSLPPTKQRRAPFGG